MKILICINRDIYSDFSLNYLFHHLDNHDVKLCISEKVGEKPASEDLRNLIEQETKDTFSEACFINSNNQKHITFDKNSAKLWEILPFKNINKDGLHYLEKWQPDLIISIRFGQILTQDVINIPTLGILNFHSGALPFYRGVMATFWALLHNETRIGSTLHFITDTGIDTGDIVNISYLDVNPQESFMWHVHSLYRNNISVITHAVNKLAAGIALKSVKQDPSLARYFSYPSQTDVDNFKKKYLLF